MDDGRCARAARQCTRSNIRHGENSMSIQFKVTSHRLAAALGREVEIDLDAVLNDYVQHESNGK